MAAVVQVTQNTSTGGIPTVGIKELMTTGAIFFVDSNNGAATNNGLTSGQALDTIPNALTLCTANKGDVILLMPNHAETLSAEVSMSTAGVTIISLGNGDNRAVLTFDNTAAGITMAAKNLRLSNIVFQNDIDNQVEMVDIANAAYAQVDRCLFLEGSSKQFLIGISITNAGADHVKILSCEMISKTAGADSGIKIGVAASDIEIADCRIVGDWADAGIHNPTSAIATELSIHDNYVEQDQANDHAIELVSACTGGIFNNVLYADAIATVLDPGSCKCGGNKANIAIDQGAVEVPLGATHEDFIGADNSNNNAATTSVAANEDGSILERLEQLQEAVNKGSGSAMPANTSIADFVGQGTATKLASNESLADVLYANNGIITFPASAIPANNVSMAEVLREIYDQAENSISNTAVALTGGDVADVFTVAGAPIMILGLWVDITTAVSANASLLHFESDPTVGASNTDIAEGTSAPDIASAAVGDVFFLDGDSQDIMVKAANGTDLPHMSKNNMGIYCPVGGIDLKLSTSDPSTGIATLWLRYKPLGRACIVT